MLAGRHLLHDARPLLAPLTCRCFRAETHLRVLVSRHSLHRKQRTRLRMHTVSSAVSEHARYINEVAMVARPERLDAFLQVLEAQGHSLVSPDDRSGLHPLLVPLARQRAPPGDGGSSGGDIFTCLLRWPDTSGARGLPVVRMARGGVSVELLARSCGEFLHRALAEEDAAGQSGQPGSAAAALAGGGAEGIYEPGAYGHSGLPSVDSYLTRAGGMFPDVIERLALGHLARGDHMSALITAEWYVRRKHFPGFARPFEFNAQLFSRLGRSEEAQDGARVALRFPWWTLAHGFGACAQLAGLPGSAAAVQGALDEASSVNKGGLPPSMAATRTPTQVAMDEADFLLNRVAAGEGDWDSVRPPLAAKYAEAGLQSMADFVIAGKT